ncbi:hypothetical protein KZ287_31985, partial [Escherichia coli]|nr:hypothetical protein [Escherichia coli]
GLGFIFGPALGGLLSSVSLFFPFTISGILALIMTTYAFFALPESLQQESVSQEKKTTLQDFNTDFKGAMKYLYLLSFFGTFTL